MEYEILKKVNEPLSFKGFKGVYLFKAIGVIGIAAILIAILIGALDNRIVILIGILIISISVFFILNGFKKSSKEDYYITYKKAANKKIFVKGVIINYDDLKTNDTSNT